MELYDLVKYVHVVAAITAVGSDLSYGVWMGLTARSRTSACLSCAASSDWTTGSPTRRMSCSC